MSDYELTEDERTRLGAWWASLDEPTREHLKNLGEDDVPPDIVDRLQAADFFGMYISRRADGSDSKLYGLRAVKSFLAQKRQE